MKKKILAAALLAAVLCSCGSTHESEVRKAFNEYAKKEWTGRTRIAGISEICEPDTVSENLKALCRVNLEGMSGVPAYYFIQYESKGYTDAEKYKQAVMDAFNKALADPTLVIQTKVIADMCEGGEDMGTKAFYVIERVDSPASEKRIYVKDTPFDSDDDFPKVLREAVSHCVDMMAWVDRMSKILKH